MTANWSRWAVVAHKDDSGFGRQAEDIRAALGIKYQLVIPSERLHDKPLDGATEFRLDPKCPEHEVRELVSGLEGILFFERPNWHPELLRSCRELGVSTVCAPNWEWFRGDDPLWKYCDLFACTSRFTLAVVQGYGWLNTVCVGPWPINLEKFPLRKISGPARIFIHNAGIVDPDDRKGTRDTIRAFKRLRNPNIRLIVRMQKEAELPKPDDRVEIRVGNLANPAELYAEGDVAIQPSKMEGNGFMVLEPLCCGLPVITTNYPPMNEYVRQPELCVTPRWFKRRAFPTRWIPQAHLRLPHPKDLARKIEWCAQNELTTISRENREWAKLHFASDRVNRIWNDAVEDLPRRAPVVNT